MHNNEQSWLRRNLFKIIATSWWVLFFSTYICVGYINYLLLLCHLLLIIILIGLYLRGNRTKTTATHIVIVTILTIIANLPLFWIGTVTTLQDGEYRSYRDGSGGFFVPHENFVDACNEYCVSRTLIASGTIFLITGYNHTNNPFAHTGNSILTTSYEFSDTNLDQSYGKPTIAINTPPAMLQIFNSINISLDLPRFYSFAFVLMWVFK